MWGRVKKEMLQNWVYLMMFVQIVWGVEFIIIRQVNLNFQKTSEHFIHRRGNFYSFVNYWMEEGGGGISNIQSHLNMHNNTMGYFSFFSSLIGLVGSPRIVSFLKNPFCIWLICSDSCPRTSSNIPKAKLSLILQHFLFYPSPHLRRLHTPHSTNHIKYVTVWYRESK